MNSHFDGPFLILFSPRQVERGKNKCFVYWPTETESEKQFGRIRVTLLKELPAVDFILRKLSIQCDADADSLLNSSDAEERIIHQYHFSELNLLMVVNFISFTNRLQFSFLFYSAKWPGMRSILSFDTFETFDISIQTSSNVFHFPSRSRCASRSGLRSKLSGRSKQMSRIVRRGGRDRPCGGALFR